MTPARFAGQAICSLIELAVALLGEDEAEAAGLRTAAGRCSRAPQVRSGRRGRGCTAAPGRYTGNPVPSGGMPPPQVGTPLKGMVSHGPPPLGVWSISTGPLVADAGEVARHQHDAGREEGWPAAP